MKSLLIADDSLTMRRVVSECLENEAFHIDQAEDGLQALKLAKNNHYDLILTDYHMPKMMGIALIKELRLLDQYRETPMLVLSSESDPNIKQKGKLAGVTGWLLKPIDKVHFSENVTKLLNK